MAEEATYNFEVFDLDPLAEIGDAVEDVASLPPSVRALCDGVARALHETGCLVVRAPGAGEALNDRFLDLMEAYFGRSAADKLADARPEHSYQVGATPSGVERPRCLADPEVAARMAALPAGHEAARVTGPDAKERFFWRVGPRPADAGPYAELNAPPVVPAGFDRWAETMDAWGAAMLGAARLAATAAAVGFGLPARALAGLMEYGPHLLAPTGSDLAKHGQAVGTVLAGFHYDLNLLTIHGRSRFPGLRVWLRDGRRVAVRGIPPGCLLIQAGKQLEWLTGGHVQAGWHEVIVTPSTAAAAAAAAAAGRSTWRVSSTVFAHVASSRVLAPLGKFADLPGAASNYPPTEAGAQVQAELAAIRLASRPGSGGGSGGGASATVVAACGQAPKVAAAPAAESSPQHVRATG